jgi:hypothetical protein
MKAEPQASPMQALPQDDFGFCIPSPDAAHVVRALRRAVNVCHHSPSDVASATTAFSVALISAVLMPGRRVTAPNLKLPRYDG